MKQERKASMYFIFATILLDVIGIGLIIPVLPKLVTIFCNNDLSDAAKYSGVLIGVYALMQFIFAPIMGGLSDQYGRRPILLASMFGFGLDYLLLAFAPNLAWLFVGRVIAGITGASFTTANAYIADISDDSNRTQNFGMVGAAFGLGFIIGPVIGGLLASYDLKLPFFVASALSIINWLYGYFVLPESLSLEKRRPFDIKRANPIGSVLRLKKYPNILGTLAVLVCLFLGGQVHPSTWALFTIKEFQWDAMQIGFSLAFVGLAIGFVQGFLIRITTPKFGRDKSIIIGLIAYIVGFFLFSTASHGWMMYAFMIPFALGGLATPNLQSAVSGQVNPNEQGELQGSLTSIMSLTAFIGPIVHTNLFAYFSKPDAIVFYPGAAFLMGSLLSAFALVLYLKSDIRNNDNEKIKDEEVEIPVR